MEKNLSAWAQYSSLLDVHINGISQVGLLAERGQTEEARDLLISCARSAWQYRWRTARRYTLRRLGEELDTERFPLLAPVAEALTAETPGAARQFLHYLRQRKQPDIEPFLRQPSAPPLDFQPAGQYSAALWNAWVTTGRADVRDHLDRRIAEYLDPHRIITWHETAGNWAALVVSALHHGGIADETLCALILFGLDHAEECNVTCHLAEPAQPSVGGNHFFAWITAWLHFAVLFPEFRRAPCLRDAAVARLDDEVSRQVMPDGSMIEGCPGYHNCCLYGASGFLDLAARYGFELPARTRQAWERMLGFAIGLQQPDFRAPYFGDSQDNYTPWFVGQARRHFPLPEAAWSASEGKEGTPPSFTSRAYPCIGYYVQRSGWSRDALYLCFDGGRFGQAHFHEDKLHFVLWAYGRRFLTDAGNHSYSNHWMAQWSVLSQAHNTVLVDDAGQCRWRGDRGEWYSHVPLKNRWSTGPDWDVVEADFDGPFERDIGPVRIWRRVAFHKGAPPFWWITDRVEGSGEHDVAALFHFAHDIAEVGGIPGGVRTRVPGGPDLAIVANGGETVVRLFRGERDPVRGWMSPALGAAEPAWEVHFAGRGLLPMRRDYLLLPWQEALPEDLRVAWRREGGASDMEIRTGAQRFRVRLPER